MVSALMLLAAPLCMAQAQTAECDSMTTTMMTPMGGDHQDHGQSAPASKLDCAVGCRLVPQLTPLIEVPERVAYSVYYAAEPRTLDGIVIDPAVPPPRWMV